MSDSSAALEILERAMKVEEEGRKFYEKASETTEDEKGRELFSTLANDEVNHYDLIKKQYDSLKSLGTWADASEVKPPTADISKPLFPLNRAEMEKKITKKTSEWDAILFGLDIEIRSFELYRQAAADTTDSLGKHFYEFLSGEEMGHYTNLITRYELLFGELPQVQR